MTREPFRLPEVEIMTILFAAPILGAFAARVLSALGFAP